MFARVLRLVAVAAAVTVISLVGLAGPARAHTALESSSPVAGEVLTKAPEVITLTFSGTISDQFVQVAVTAPDGESINSAPATVEGAVVRQPVTVAADGAHVVAYRVVSNDGHPVTGQFTFSMQGTTPDESTPEPGQQTAAPSPDDDRASADALRPTETDDTGLTSMPGFTITATIVAVTMTALVVVLLRRGTR